VIALYLNEKLKLNLSFDRQVQKELALINEANDAAILLFQFRKFGLDANWKTDISQRFYSRVERVLEYFEKNTPSAPGVSDLSSIWLLSMLDWMLFRDVVPLKPNHKNLQDFVRRCMQVVPVQKTDPRLP